MLFSSNDTSLTFQESIGLPMEVGWVGFWSRQGTRMRQGWEETRSTSPLATLGADTDKIGFT